jgi:hypothetical protein
MRTLASYLQLMVWTRAWVFAAVVLVAACSTAGVAPGTPIASPARSAATLFLPRCPSSVRPQSELDFAGLPPLVPSGPPLKCLLNASNGGTPYDSPYDASIELDGGRMLHLYERRGGLLRKSTVPPRSQVEGLRKVGDVSWMWTILPGPTASLTATLNGIYVELDLPGDQSELDVLGAIASSLRPVSSLPRPSAREICAALPVSTNPITVAAAFDSTAAAVARWQETPEATAGPLVTAGPHLVSSPWRDHPADEPVAVCYLDGDFGVPKGGPPGAGTSATPMPNWSRVVYLVGVDRHPIGWTYGWKDRIAIRDPGR